MMRPTLKLGELIATHMSVPGHVLPSRPEAEFVMSGLRAAAAVNAIAREKILSDVSDVLGCHSKDLEFLFSGLDLKASPAENYEVMVPDFQSQLFAVAE